MTAPRQTVSKSNLQKTGVSDRTGRLLSWVSPYKWRLILATIALLIGGAIHLAVPYGLRVLVDSALVTHNETQLNRTMLLLVVSLLIAAAFEFLKSYQTAYVGERVVKDLRERLYEHLQRLSLAFYDRHRTGEILSHITNDAAVIQGTLSNNLIAAPQYLFTIIFGIIMIIVTDSHLAVYFGGVVPVLALISVLFGRQQRRLSFLIQTQLSEGVTVLEETLSGQRIVKAFAREEHEARRFSGSLEKYFQLCMRRARFGAAFGATIWLSIFSSLAGLFWYGGHEVLAGRLTPGALISFVLYIIFLVNPAEGLARLYVLYQQALGASERIFTLLNTQPDIKDADDAYALPEGPGQIGIVNVGFSYGDNGDARAVLRNVSLTIEPGRTVALVGPSGAGKSTLANLIPRFYEPQEGRILIDGHDITKVTQKSLRNTLAIVPQETLLFSGTVRENIAYGKADSSELEIRDAAVAANAHDFILELPEGYDTPVGERGVMLSGGQRQRIAIARALLKNPRMLILDEATSSLDNESESLVQEALGRLMESRTTLVIAHRLSTIEQADEIVFLHSGQIVERGTHAELLARQGFYSRLYHREFNEEGKQIEPVEWTALIA